MADEEKDLREIIRPTQAPKKARQGNRGKKKAKLTSDTYAGLRYKGANTATIEKAFKKYNDAYSELMEIAEHINGESKKGSPDMDAIKESTDQYNAKAEKLAKLAVKVIAIDEETKEIALIGTRVKAIRVPSYLVRLTRVFTSVGRKKNKEYKEEQAAVEEAVVDVARRALEKENETVNTSQLKGLSLKKKKGEVRLVRTLNEEKKNPYHIVIEDLATTKKTSTPEGSKEKVEIGGLFKKIQRSPIAVQLDGDIDSPESRVVIPMPFATSDEEYEKKRSRAIEGLISVIKSHDTEPDLSRVVETFEIINNLGMEYYISSSDQKKYVGQKNPNSGLIMRLFDRETEQGLFDMVVASNTWGRMKDENNKWVDVPNAYGKVGKEAFALMVQYITAAEEDKSRIVRKIDSIGEREENRMLAKHVKEIVLSGREIGRYIPLLNIVPSYAEATLRYHDATVAKIDGQNIAQVAEYAADLPEAIPVDLWSAEEDVEMPPALKGVDGTEYMPRHAKPTIVQQDDSLTDAIPINLLPGEDTEESETASATLAGRSVFNPFGSNGGEIAAAARKMTEVDWYKKVPPDDVAFEMLMHCVPNEQDVTQEIPAEEVTKALAGAKPSQALAGIKNGDPETYRKIVQNYEAYKRQQTAGIKSTDKGKKV